MDLGKVWIWGGSVCIEQYMLCVRLCLLIAGISLLSNHQKRALGRLQLSVSHKEPVGVFRQWLDRRTILSRPSSFGPIRAKRRHSLGLRRLLTSCLPPILEAKVANIREPQTRSMFYVEERINLPAVRWDEMCLRIQSTALISVFDLRCIP